MIGVTVSSVIEIFGVFGVLGVVGVDFVFCVIGDGFDAIGT